MATYTTISAFTAGQTLASATMNSVKNNLDLTNAQSLYRFRNLLHNGAMNVAQRGAAGTTSVSTTKFPCVDRWSIGLSSAGTYTITQATDAPDSSGLSVSSKIACTAAVASPGATASATYQQILEGQDVQHMLKGTASALQVTLTFWVKSTTTGTYVVEIGDLTNTRFVSASYTINNANTWEQKTITFPADTTGVIANSAAGGLLTNFWLVAGSNYSSGTLSTTWGTTSANRAVGQTNFAALNTNTWQVTGVQLEIGAVSTPFEIVPYGDELRRCQRYYAQSYEIGTAPGTVTTTGMETWTVGSNGASLAHIKVPLPVAMRSTSPTITLYSDSTSATGTWHYARNTAANDVSATADMITSKSFHVSLNVGATWVPAHLYGHWVASAEI